MNALQVMRSTIVRGLRLLYRLAMGRPYSPALPLDQYAADLAAQDHVRDDLNRRVDDLQRQVTALTEQVQQNGLDLQRELELIRERFEATDERVDVVVDAALRRAEAAVSELRLETATAPSV